MTTLVRVLSPAKVQPVVEVRGESLVVSRFGETVTDDELRAYMDRLSEVARAKKRWVHLVDCSVANPVSAAQRRMMADWIKKETPALRGRCVASAYVLPSALLRGVLTAILWLTRHPVPHTAVETVAEGERWCRAQLDDHQGIQPMP